MSIVPRVSAPWSVQIELVEGCSRACSFCGINAIRPRPGNYKCMTPETATHAAVGLADLCPNARYEFAMHGEPLQHPQAARVIALFRSMLPKAQFQLTTNGKVLMARDVQYMARRLDDLFRYGIDIIVVDTYEPERNKLQWMLYQVGQEGAYGITVQDFYGEWAPKKMSPWTNYRRKIQRTVVVMDDLGLRSGETMNRVISNHAGNSPTMPWPDEPLHRTCTLPYRELSICYNGDVNLCCNDWGHEYTCGNTNVVALQDIWYGNAFESARRVLGQKDRGFSPCNRCDARSGSRAGLLPKYPAPGPGDGLVIQLVHASSKVQNGHAPYISPHLLPT